MINKVDEKKTDSILKTIYYDVSTAGSYLGPDKLYTIIKNTNIGKHTVRKWLQNQDNYSLQKPVRQTFRKARVIVSGIDDQFDADLADVPNISHENDGVKYLFVVIDIFSKYLWIQPLKNKRAKDVVNGFKLISD
jgi:hypothetical protein